MNEFRNTLHSANSVALAQSFEYANSHIGGAPLIAERDFTHQSNRFKVAPLVQSTVLMIGGGALSKR